MHATRRPSLFVRSCVVGLALTTGLAACSGGDDRAPTVYHRGDSISVGTGDEFVIALVADPSTGYTWAAGDNPNVTLVGSKQVDSDVGRPGARGTQQLRFRATKKGRSTLQLAYAQQFQGGVPPARIAKFPLKVS
jgi:predicted secreted protein